MTKTTELYNLLKEAIIERVKGTTDKIEISFDDGGKVIIFEDDIGNITSVHRIECTEILDIDAEIEKIEKELEA